MNSLGGSVKLFSKPATGSGGFVEGTLGEVWIGAISGAARISLLVPDTLFARISGVARKRDGYIKRLDYACKLIPTIRT